MIPFDKGVRFITAIPRKKDGKIVYVEQKWKRALEWFTRWHIALAKAESPKDEKRALAKADKMIQLVKKRGGWRDEMTLCTARNAFQYWKEQERSRSAKSSRLKRGKKKDKRRGARPP